MTPIVDLQRSLDRVRAGLAAAAVAALLAACGGGSGGGEAEPPVVVAPPPPAVTATIAATAGGVVEADLVGGGKATLLFAADTFAADQPATVTPLAVESGEWTRFSIDPGIAQMRAPLQLRVRPPSSLSAAEIPVLQLVGAGEPVLLRATLMADGTLQALVPPLLEAPETVAASSGRARTAAAPRPQAAASGSGSTVAGTGFLAFCKAPKAAVDNARKVILNASKASQVTTALSVLATLHERCAADAAAALQELAAELPALYAQALSEWQAVNYIEAEAQLDTLKRGARRLFALCAASQELGASLTCPTAADFEGQYSELVDGFTAAAHEREDGSNLRLLFDQLLPLPQEAEVFGLPEAAPALRNTLALIADRLMDRAYELCNEAELFEWLLHVEGGGESSRSVETLRRAMAYCGVQVSVHTEPVRAGEVSDTSMAPGTLDGTGRSVERTLTMPFDGSVEFKTRGASTHCSRVIGAPVGNEPLILKVGDKQLDRIAAVNGSYDGGVVLRNIPDLIAAVGLSVQSTRTLRVDVYRGAVSVPGCSDSRGNALAIVAEETLLYSLTLKDSRGLTLLLESPATLSGPAIVSVKASEGNSPAVGASVSISVSGGFSSGDGVTDAEGSFSFTLTPTPGEATVTLGVEVVAVDGARGQIAKVFVVAAPRSWSGTISMNSTFINRIAGSTDQTTTFSARRVVEVSLEAEEGSKTFTVMGEEGDGVQRLLSFPLGCVVVADVKGPVVKDSREIKPQLIQLGDDGSYKISFGSVIAAVTGMKVATCEGLPTTTSQLPTSELKSGNNAEPQERYQMLADGSLVGSETRVVRTGTPDGTVLTETTRTVSWSLAPR